MCQFKSLVVTRTEILHDLDADSHDDLVKAYGLNDKTTSPDFVRVEFLPLDMNIFNHDRKNWELSVDQDYLPEWFSLGEAEEACWPLLEKTFRERFISTGQSMTINRWRWFAYGSASVEASGSASVHAHDSASVHAHDSASVHAYGSASVHAYDSASVEASGSAVIICGISSQGTKWSLKDKSIAIIRYETPTRIVTAEKDAKLEICD